jgi:4a-hydroxytetrahydrobiopterin dehydratase
VSEPLAKKSCVPCHGGVAALTPAEIHVLARSVPTWIAHAIPTGRAPFVEKSYAFPDFAQALAFVNQVGALAEAEGHHPDLHLAWGKVRIEIWTHAIGGLSESDFILAAKIDAL